MSLLERLRGDLPLVVPSIDTHVDVDALARAWPDRTIKGLFLLNALRKAPDPDLVRAESGLYDRRFHAFSDLPYDTFLRALFSAAKSIYPRLSNGAAVRRLTHGFYAELAQSLAGRVVFGVLDVDPGRIFPSGAKGWQMTLGFGKFSAVTLGPTQVRYLFEDYPPEMVHTSDVGVVQGALDMLGVRGTVKWCCLEPRVSVLEVRWG